MLQRNSDIFIQITFLPTLTIYIIPLKLPPLYICPGFPPCLGPCLLPNFGQLFLSFPPIKDMSSSTVHFNIITLYLDIKRSHVKVIMLYVDKFILHAGGRCMPPLLFIHNICTCIKSILELCIS